MSRRKLIAITGGIGSGKSVVSEVLRVKGYAVYDCDSEAKRLMDSSAEIRRRIASDVDPKAILPDGTIDRCRLSSTVFSDGEALERLNSIVHGAVRADLEKWSRKQGPLCFVETAILYESGLDKMVDEVWEVKAPEELRIKRVERRSHLTRAQVEARIAAQKNGEVEHPHPCTYSIHNDEIHAMLPQIHNLLHKTTR
ncbi:MAG: dephospho-CoA kinase [Bacteroidales bacterium]|nr:dephospho-CoA kinase [Bacteroidales bacterium]